MPTEREPNYELRGVRLQDVFRDQDGNLWEVVGLTDEPTAVVREVLSQKTEHIVIGCGNWQAKWRDGPMRP